MSEDKMKKATMRLSMNRLRRLGWHWIACLQKLPPQEKYNHDCQKEVNRGEDNERRGQSGHGCYSFLSPHHAVNDPGLASCFRHDPPGFDRQKSQRPGSNHSAQKPTV